MKEKGGRPNKGDEARNIQATFYISETENTTLKELITKSKLTRSSFLYQVYKKGKVDIVETFGLDKEQLRLFSIANNNLNQIARQINTTKQTSLDIETLNALNIIGKNLAKLMTNDR